ncbi:hypothetical protein [Geobacillus sp. PK12]|nr:hypothetical protein [Geobacillus sp. PK12]
MAIAGRMTATSSKQTAKNAAFWKRSARRPFPRKEALADHP